jgi:hypothetical protein
MKFHVVTAVVITAVAACAQFSSPKPDAPPGQSASASAAAPAPAGGTTPAAPTFIRTVTPFEVRDAAGKLYAHPFLGGFDVPRPHFIDIDADGDFDLFVQERSNELMFFENTGSASAPVYVWRTDRYQDLDVGEWTRFVDIDADGDIDLLGEIPFSYVRLFRNEGTRQRAAFRALPDSLRDQEGRAVFADRQNIPNIVDIDCDRLLDLFLGRVDGTVTRYEEIAGSRANGGVPRFEFVTDRWEDIEIIGQISPGASMRHGANTMFFADHDADGDQDLFWGDFFEDGVLLISNHGSCTSPQFRSQPVPLMVGGAKLSTSGYNVPVFVDIDADKDVDLFVGILGGAFNANKTAADNFYFLERRGAELELRTRRFLSMIDVGNESVPALGDIDGDGDLDLLVGNKLVPEKQTTGRLHVFRNTGTNRQPKYRLQDSVELMTAFHYAPTLADLDGDRDLDLVLGTWNNGVFIYRNDGTVKEPRWVQDAGATITLTRGSNSTPALVDIDADGDLDLFIGEQSGEINFYRNTGSAASYRFELVSDVFDGLDVGRRSHPAFLDVDRDGDFDMLSGSDAGGLAYFRNDGTKLQPKFVADTSFKIPLPHYAAPTLADVDGDGDLDLIAGALSGGLFYFEHR